LLPWSHLPVVVAVVAFVSGALVYLDIGVVEVFGTSRPTGLLFHLAGLVLHRGPAHYRGNMFLLVPFGVVLTGLTSNRHVLAVILVAHLSSSVLYGGLAGGIIGSSVAAYGIAAATLVRTIGLGMQNASMEWLQTILAGILTPFLTTLLVVAILTPPDGIAHLGHFYGFLFGAGLEAVFVVAEHSHVAD
jgi:membrane associated rhomboid family serine protease